MHILWPSATTCIEVKKQIDRYIWGNQEISFDEIRYVYLVHNILKKLIIKLPLSFHLSRYLLYLFTVQIQFISKTLIFPNKTWLLEHCIESSVLCSLYFSWTVLYCIWIYSLAGKPQLYDVMAERFESQNFRCFRIWYYSFDGSVNSMLFKLANNERWSTC